MIDERSFEAYRLRALHQVDDALKEVAAAQAEILELRLLVVKNPLAGVAFIRSLRRCNTLHARLSAASESLALALRQLERAKRLHGSPGVVVVGVMSGPGP